MTDRETALGILHTALEKSGARVDFELVVDDQRLAVCMRDVDIFEMSRLQELAMARTRAEAAAEGLDRLPVDEERWRAFKEEAAAAVENKARRKTVLSKLEKERPRNLADQLAREGAWIAAARKMIPKVLYFDGELLFAGTEGMAVYERLMNRTEIFQLLVSKYTELVALSGERSNAVKN